MVTRVPARGARARERRMSWLTEGERRTSFRSQSTEGRGQRPGAIQRNNFCIHRACFHPWLCPGFHATRTGDSAREQRHCWSACWRFLPNRQRRRICRVNAVIGKCVRSALPGTPSIRPQRSPRLLRRCHRRSLAFRSSVSAVVSIPSNLCATCNESRLCTGDAAFPTSRSIRWYARCARASSTSRSRLRKGSRCGYRR